jgi:predicted ribosome quality control (RQC) complex YloA/Tae2 family protein
MEITSLDLSVLEREFKQFEQGHVQKVYQRGEELTIEIYVGGEGKKRLIIGPDRAFISKYKRDNPQRPPGFAMELRKHLGKVDEIKQRKFDRILILKSGDINFIAEMFGKGNFILTKGGKIIGALREEKWADREIRVGLEYEFPEPVKDPRDADDYFELMEDGEIVRKMASDLSLGGTYAEEICERTDIEKDREISELEKEEKEELRDEIENILEAEKNPKLYSEEMPVRAAPFPLRTYSSREVESFEDYSEALDEFYYRKKSKKKEKELQEKYQEKMEGLKRQKEQQERKIEGLKKSSEQNRENAEKIYQNYRELEKVKRNIEKMIEDKGWDQAEKKIEESEREEAEKINTLNQQNEFFSYTVDGENLKIWLFQDLEATASQYYDKAKNSESKIESAKKALEETEKKIEEVEKEEIDLEDEVMEDKTQKRSKKWFEKYRWFHSSEDHLVVIGRDSQTNEMLVNKHMEKNDIYMHSDFDGAPSVVVKDGQEAGEETLKEAAKAAVTFTKAWKAGIGAADVYYVDPEQVTKNPESGEYLSKGAFVIRGEREYIHNVKTEAWIGPYQLEDTHLPVCGPEKAVKENCEEAIELRPGNQKKSEIAKKIKDKFNDYDLNLDYIIRSLPPGKSEIKN